MCLKMGWWSQLNDSFFLGGGWCISWEKRIFMMWQKKDWIIYDYIGISHKCIIKIAIGKNGIVMRYFWRIYGIFVGYGICTIHHPQWLTINLWNWNHPHVAVLYGMWFAALSIILQKSDKICEDLSFCMMFLLAKTHSL